MFIWTFDDVVGLIIVGLFLLLVALYWALRAYVAAAEAVAKWWVSLKRRWRPSP